MTILESMELNTERHKTQLHCSAEKILTGSFDLIPARLKRQCVVLLLLAISYVTNEKVPNNGLRRSKLYLS